MWNAVRFTTYASGFLAVAGGLFAAWGYGTYDPASGLFDPAPLHLPTIGGIIGAGLANGMAALAVWRGWGR